MTEVFSGINYDNLHNTYTISTIASQTDIQTILDTAPDNAVITFKSGTFEFSESLVVSRDNITINGSSVEGSPTVFKFAANVTDNAFEIRGKEIGDVVHTLSENISSGATVITLDDAGSYTAGDILHIYQANDEAFFSSGIYDPVKDLADMALNPLRETYVEVLSVEGNVVTLKHAVGYDMDAGLAEVTKVDVLKNVSVSDLTLTYDTSSFGELDNYNYENVLGQFNGHSTMAVKNTDNIQISNITFQDVPSNGLEVKNSVDAVVSDITVDGAYNKGGEGNGYGVYIYGTSYSTFEGLTITDVRHAVLFSSWNAEIGNYVQVDYTNRDINYHGSPDHSNTVIVTESVYDTDGDRAWALVSPGAAYMHPYTEISDNTNLFGHAEGSFKDDTIYGWDSGATLMGLGGDDILVGGAGSDVIDGGMGSDLLTGDLGSDLFVFRAGEGQDTITDFQVGIGGDVLEISGYNSLSTMADIRMEQTGGDTLLTFMASGSLLDTILLENVNVADLDELNFSITANITPVPLDLFLSTGADFINSSGNVADVITTYISGISDLDFINLGEGNDTLTIITDSFSLHSEQLINTSGIDVIDVSQTSFAKLALDQSVLNRTDNQTITIKYGEQIVERLGLYNVEAESKVMLEGTGGVVLANDTDNTVIISDTTHGVITGGRANDTFILSTADHVTVNGGDGDDVFELKSGTIDKNISINGNDGFDTLHLLAASRLVGSSMNGVSGIDRILFDKTGADIQLNDAMTSSGTIYLETTGASLFSEKIRVGGLTQAADIVVGANIKLYLSGTTSLGTTVHVQSDVAGNVKGSMAGDTLIGGDQKDYLYGLDGDDIIIGGLGKDSLTGGNGQDTFVYNRGDALDQIKDFQAGAGGDIIQLNSYYSFTNFDELKTTFEQRDGMKVKIDLGNGEYIFLRNMTVDSLTADNFAFDNSLEMDVSLTATSKAERLVSVSGDDSLYVDSSKDLGVGDVVSMGTGFDTMYLIGTVGTLNTTLFTINGIELIDASAVAAGVKLIVSDELAGSSDRGDLDVLVGVNGLTLDTSNVTTDHTVVLLGNNVSATLVDGVNNTVTLDQENVNFSLVSGSGDDTIRTRGGSGDIDAGAGNDRVTLMDGSDFSVSLGDGDDILSVNEIADLKGHMVDGGTGYDEIRLYQADTLTFDDLSQVTGIERLTLAAGVNNLELDATLFDTELYLKASSGTSDVYIDTSRLNAAKTLVADISVTMHLSGELGDSYSVSTGSGSSQTTYGSVANETYNGGSTNDTIYANEGNDTLLGGYGNDKLYGEGGDDLLQGGRGNDTLTGGEGNDVFKFVYHHDGADIITDFHSILGDQDALDLTEMFEVNGLGDMTFNEATSGSYLNFQQSGDNVLVYFDRNGTKTGDPVLIATVEHTIATDFDTTNVIL